MRHVLILLVFSLLGIPQPGFSQTVYKCTDSSGTIIFSDSPCAIDAQELYIENTNSGISPSDSYYAEDQFESVSELGYSQPHNTRSIEASRKRVRSNENAMAIETLKSEARKACGKKYWGKSDSQLERSASISRSQSPSESKRKSTAEISCHKRYREKIERIKTGGLEYALEYERQEAAKRAAPVKYAHGADVQSPGTQNQINQNPEWLIDTRTGQAMPRTGAGYTDPMTGTFYSDVGAGVINTRTQEFSPTHD